MLESGYIRIRPEYALRGWQGLPYALVQRGHKPLFMEAGPFRTVQFCNGRFEAKSPVFMGESKRHLEELDRLGLIEYLDEPGHLLPEQEYRLYGNRYLEAVHWSITGRCNYRCRHCYMRAPHAVLPQPPLEQCLDIADQIADCGVPRVSLTGGEPLVRRDFLQIVDRILERGMSIFLIMTNGALVDETLLDELDARGCRPELNMSFDGPREQHDWLRGVDGAYDSVRRALTLCRDRGFPTGTELVLHRGNVGALRESVRLLGELGVGPLVVGSVNDEGEACSMAGQILSYDEVFDICCEYLPQFLEDGCPVPSLTLCGTFQVQGGEVRLLRGGVDHGEGCADSPACDGMRDSMYLGADGAILPCIPMSCEGKGRDTFPNVANMTISEALTDSSYWDLVEATAGDVFERNPECRKCAYRARCLGGCRAKGVDEHGNPDAMRRDPGACRYFLGGYYERAREVVERCQGAPS